MGRSAIVLALAMLIACAHASSDAGDGGPDGAKLPDAKFDGNGCSVQPCTILPQCGCGTSACDVDTLAVGQTACRPITTQGRETASCNSLDDCDKGYVCLGNTQYASCKKYCTADAECGTPRGKCAIDISSGGQPLAGIPPACSSNCLPTSTNPPECPATFKCQIFTTTHNSAQVTIADCSLAGAGGQGANCKVGTTGDDTLCNKGLSCTTINGGTNYLCRKYCTDPPNATSAQCGGTNCFAFTTPLTLDGVTYGVCGP